MKLPEMIRMSGAIGAIGAAIVLAGCNETAGGAMGGPNLSAPLSPDAMVSATGAACSNEIGRYQRVVKADLETGNVERTVYDQIQTEMARAASACFAGKGGEAHAIVAASKAQHGYRV